MPKINKKRVFVCLGILLAIFVLAFLLYSPIIFQEGNPWPEIKGIAQLKFSDSDIVKLSGSDNKFMTESKNGTVIHDFMKTDANGLSSAQAEERLAKYGQNKRLSGLVLFQISLLLSRRSAFHRD